jgi:hypothetical protein
VDRVAEAFVAGVAGQHDGPLSGCTGDRAGAGVVLARAGIDFGREVEDGWAIFVPAGTWHNITNIGDEPMQLYAVYAPVHHASGKIHTTAVDAERDEESGNDEPPTWSVQPAEEPPDEHA